MLEIGTFHQAGNITPGHTIQTVWGERVEVFEVDNRFGSVAFNPNERQVILGAEEQVKILGYFNLD